jgi:hypothetical protein
VTSPAVDAEHAIVLRTDELQLLALLGEVEAGELAPFQLPTMAADVPLASAERTLRLRGLFPGKHLRAHRELARRLLVLSEPTGRTTLDVHGPGGPRRLVDVLERAGAHVSYAATPDGRHVLGPVIGGDLALTAVLRHLDVRRAFGDFVAATLDRDAYFVLSMLAADLWAECSPTTREARLAPVVTGRGRPIAPGAIAEPDAPEGRPRAASRLGASGTALASLEAEPPPERRAWAAVVDELERLDLVERRGRGLHLRPFVEDLGLALAARARLCLRRLDHRADDSLARTATLVPVPGSMFSVTATADGRVALQELDARGLADVLDRTLRTPPSTLEGAARVAHAAA